MTFFYSMSNPFPQVFGLNGQGLNGGKIYIGIAGQDPETNPKTVYWDEAGIDVAEQPLQTSAGYIVREGAPATVFLNGPYSIRVRDRHNVEIYYQPNVLDEVLQFIADISSPEGAGLVGFSHDAANAAGSVGGKLAKTIYVTDEPYGAVGNGTADDTAAILAAVADAGANGSIIFPRGGTFLIDYDGMITVGSMVFQHGAILRPAPGSDLIIDARIEAGAAMCFDTGKMVTACDCNTGSTALRTWTYGFEGSDAGKPICLKYGGAPMGTAVPNFVPDRAPFNTVVSGVVSPSQLTLSAPPISAIRQDYVINMGYAPVNTGIAIIGNGTITFTQKVDEINVAWFGATGNGSTDDAVALNKAYRSVSRVYGGAKFIHPNGQYIQGQESRIDVGNCTLYSTPRGARFFRKNGVPLEQMNNITTAWRGRYGGGGPTNKPSEDWTFLGLSNSYTVPYYGADWAGMEGFTLDGPIVDGNKGNQPPLTPGSGLDGWDAGLSTFRTTRCLIRSTCSFANTLRWGAALSTVSGDSTCEDGVIFDSCDEGGFYTETSDNIHCGAIICKNSPIAGYNMGAITYLRVNGGSITVPKITGGNNGIYIRGGCKNIDVDVGKVIDCATRGVWVFDEALGTDPALRPKNITINGGSVDGCLKGVEVEYADSVTITGIKGACDTHGIRIAHSNYVSISDSPVTGGTKDILIDSGVIGISVYNCLTDQEITGSSAVNVTFDVPSGANFTDSTSPSAGNLAVLDRPSFGDGKGRHRIATGGFSVKDGANWQSYPLDLGGKNLWIDTTTKLRIKNGYQTSDTDGTVVGP